MQGVGYMVLIDHDVYEERNLISQDIASANLGRSKAQLQARRLRRINPALEVHPILKTGRGRAPWHPPGERSAGLA